MRPDRWAPRQTLPEMWALDMLALQEVGLTMYVLAGMGVVSWPINWVGIHISEALACHVCAPGGVGKITHGSGSVN